jgi:hypothetical protein
MSENLPKYSAPFCGRCYKPRIICACDYTIPESDDPYNHVGKHMRAPQAGLAFRERSISDLIWVCENGNGFTFKHKLILGSFAFLFGRRVR